MALTKSQRVKLMKAIAMNLGGENWPVVDATLKQFGLPRKPNWNGPSDAYVLKMIEDATGHKIDQQGPTFLAEPKFWQPGMMRLFITHLAKHKVFAAGGNGPILIWHRVSHDADECK